MKGLLIALLAAAVVGGAWLLLPQDAPPEAGRAPLFASSAPPAPITLATTTVALGDGTEATLRVPEGFAVAVAAEGLGKARFMTWSPDGRLFVPDMVDYALSHEGSLYILRGFNEETKRFEKKETYLSGLRGPNNVAFYTDAQGRQWLYLTLTEHLVRYPYAAGDTKPSGEAEIVYEFPNEISPDADSFVWHLTRTALFVGDTLYVSVGSGCNLCEEEDENARPVIVAMNPDGSNPRVVARGIKNAVGLAWVGGSLYATDNGTDHLGADTPDDLLLKVQEGAHYGWPYCYESEGEKRAEAAREWRREPVDCASVARPFATFPAHSAPLGLTHFDGRAHEALRNSLLVALQGSWNPVLGRGYTVVRIAMDGSQETFIDGFMPEHGERFGQPVHVLQKDANSFFLADDLGGRIYYVYAR